ncbi:MAG: hypothetical protein R3344_03430 [Acidobacteriota bacterium]|nr:hypothetical protein [Acidobacteriota bacterium]
MPVGAAPNPALCTETVNPNYTAGTFQLFLREEGASAEFDVGNIDTGGFQFTPTVLEHRKGTNNSLDSIIRTGSDYTINFTAHEITARNLAAMLNESFVEVAGECQVKLTGSRCVPTYGVRLLHDFPCEDKSMEIIFWRAAILVDFTLAFTRDSWAELPGAIRALDCSSQHATEPYGRVTFTEPCPAS